MASLTSENRRDLLQALSFQSGYADHTQPADTMPIPEHLRAFEANVVLVVGDRGSGKTQLMKALQSEQIREALIRHAPTVRVPTGSIEWVQGWPLGAKGPDQGGWRGLQAHSKRADDNVATWLAYLFRTVSNELHPNELADTASICNVRGVDAQAVLACFRQSEVAVTGALDALDQRLAETQRWLYVAYDELDTIVAADWDAMGFALRGLVSFWASYSRRWTRIRPKIFLRSDFYRHNRNVAGADVAKIAGNRVELVWSSKHIYSALIKHIINKRNADGELHLRSYFLKAIKRVAEDPVLGIIPQLGKAEEAKPFVDRLISEYMGANRRKGLAFNWILDHLQDGNMVILPRSIVMLIEHAARLELLQPRASGAHLLHHTSIRNALDKVSEEYVLQAQTHELQWLAGLAERLKRDREVPWPKRDLLKMLKLDFDGSWSESRDVRPPGGDAEELLENLINLGVIRRRAGDSYDVPDLYLHGLNLVRKGGVARQ